MHSHRFGHRHKPERYALIVIGILLLIVGLGFLIQFLWNVTIASMFDLPGISYWQAVGLFILAKLFSSVGRYGRSSKFRHRKHRGWKHRGESEDKPEPNNAATFSEFWQEEGQEAYEVFLANRSEGREGEEGEGGGEGEDEDGGEGEDDKGEGSK